MWWSLLDNLEMIWLSTNIWHSIQVQLYRDEKGFLFITTLWLPKASNCINHLNSSITSFSFLLKLSIQMSSLLHLNLSRWVLFLIHIQKSLRTPDGLKVYHLSNFKIDGKFKWRQGKRNIRRETHWIKKA